MENYKWKNAIIPAKGTFFPVSSDWTEIWRPSGVRAVCPGMSSVTGQKLTGVMWLKVMHSARYAAVPPSVCISDGPSSTSAKDQRLEKELEALAPF